VKNFAFSLRVRMEKAKKIKYKDSGDKAGPGKSLSESYVDKTREYLAGDVLGIESHGQIVKNKVAEPFTRFRFPFFFTSGIPEEWCFAQLIIDRKKWEFENDLEKDGNTFVWKGGKLGVGEKGLTEAFLDDPSLMIEIEEALFL
jgi:hypothetical protein